MCNLSLLREILNFGLSEDDVGIACRTLENVGLGDHEQDVLRLANGDAGYTGNLKWFNYIDIFFYKRSCKECLRILYVHKNRESK